MRILIAGFFSCALVPTYALLGSKPHEKWYQEQDGGNLDKAFNQALPSAEREPIRTLKRVTGIPVNSESLRAGELASRDAVFTHGKEFLHAINRGLKQFDVYENKSATSYDTEDFFDLRKSDGKINTYAFDSHTSYSLRHAVSSYNNLDDERHLMSFGSIRQFEDNHIVHCDSKNPTPVGAILVGSSRGSWAKKNKMENNVARTLSNLLLHPSHLAVRVDKGLTLLRQVVRVESFETTGNEVCTKLHTESIHPLELFEAMTIKSIAESPFQHVYSGSNPDPVAGASAPEGQSRKVMSDIVFRDDPLKPCIPGGYLTISGSGADYRYKISPTVGCLEYSADLPGSFNFNYNPRTGKAIYPSMTIASGIECEECYAFLGAGILVILQYQFSPLSSSYFDVEVKGGGGAGVSAFINMRNPTVQGAFSYPLLAPANKYVTTALAGLGIKYKFGGLNAVISGSGSATGSLSFGTARSVYGSQGFIYSSANGLSYPSSYKSTSVSPSITSSAFQTESLTVALQLLATQNFDIGYSGVLTVEFDANIAGTVEYSYGATADASVSVLRGDANGNVIDTSRALRSHDANTSVGITSYLNFVPGDVTVIRFEYSDFNPFEETVLFYSIQKSDNNMYAIMQRNFTSSSTGSGIFEASWSVPWDFAFAGKGLDNMKIVVKASNAILNKFKSAPFATTLFTEHDGIFSAPRAHESIPVGTPYTLRWASDLLHYFLPSQWGTGFGEEVQSSEVNFEVVAERLFPNGSVQSSTSHRNLTQGPVPNTGECVVTFPRSLLSTSDRFYITVRATNNSETAGWSKSYFKLTADKGARLLSKTVPVLNSKKPSLSASRSSHVATVGSIRDRDLTSRNLGSCGLNEAKLSFDVEGVLTSRSVTALYGLFNLAWIASASATMSPLTMGCHAGPYKPSQAPTATPTVIPTANPTVIPTATPTVIPTATPTAYPTLQPTIYPTATPTVFPTATPTVTPTVAPTLRPTRYRTSVPQNSDSSIVTVKLSLYGFTLEATALAVTTDLIRSSIGLALGLPSSSVRDVILSQISRRSLVDLDRAASTTLTETWQLEYTIVADPGLYSVTQLRSMVQEAQDKDTLINQIRLSEPSLSAASVGTFTFVDLATAAPTTNPTAATGSYTSSTEGASASGGSIMTRWLLIGLGVGLFVGIVVGILVCICRRNLKCCKRCGPQHTGIEG